MTVQYRCTECDTVYATFKGAARCHYGIGGVVEVRKNDQALERERLKGEIVGIASGFSEHQFKELLRYIDYIKAGGAAETDRRVAAYGRTCPYCGARPGEACHAKNKRDTYCKVPHLHRISNV